MTERLHNRTPAPTGLVVAVLGVAWTSFPPGAAGGFTTSGRTSRLAPRAPAGPVLPGAWVLPDEDTPDETSGTSPVGSGAAAPGGPRSAAGGSERVGPSLQPSPRVPPPPLSFAPKQGPPSPAA